MWSSWKIILSGALIRIWMFRTGFYESLSERVEISTPVNSWKRVIEGVYLNKHSQSPYAGDIFHDTPTALLFYTQLLKLNAFSIQIIFTICDIITGLVLMKTSRSFFHSLVDEQQVKLKSYHKDASQILLKTQDGQTIPLYVLAAYLLNPYVICSCVAMTTTVFSNLVLALTLWSMANKLQMISSFLTALACHQTFYPVMLLVPISLSTHHRNRLFFSTIKTLAVFTVSLSGLLYLSYVLSGTWRFLESSYGCILKVPDLTPNIGLFWYFFTEMFDHFHVFFTYVFQMNPFVYVIPLALRFDENVPLLSFTLCAIFAIFKSYPSIGDVGFYFALLPLWNHLVQFYRHSFIVSCIILVTSVLSPILWYLWIYTGSANANFFFATTLAFATAQIFLLTDVLFAQAKYDYHLKHGTNLKIDGKEGSLVLE